MDDPNQDVKLNDLNQKKGFGAFSKAFFWILGIVAFGFIIYYGYKGITADSGDSVTTNGNTTENSVTQQQTPPPVQTVPPVPPSNQNQNLTTTTQQTNNSAGQSQGSSTFSSATGILVNLMGESFIFDNGIGGYNGVVKTENLVDNPIGDFGETKDGRYFLKKSEVDRCRPSADATTIKFLGKATADPSQGNRWIPVTPTLVGDYYVWQSPSKSPCFTTQGYDKFCWQYFKVGKKNGIEIPLQSFYPNRAVDLGAQYSETIM